MVEKMTNVGFTSSCCNRSFHLFFFFIIISFISNGKNKMPLRYGGDMALLQRKLPLRNFSHTPYSSQQGRIDHCKKIVVRFVLKYTTKKYRKCGSTKRKLHE